MGRKAVGDGRGREGDQEEPLGFGRRGERYLNEGSLVDGVGSVADDIA